MHDDHDPILNVDETVTMMHQQTTLIYIYSFFSTKVKVKVKVKVNV